MVFNTVDLNNTDLDDDNFDDDDLETIIHVRVVVWCKRHNQYRKVFLKIHKQRINACSMLSKTMVSLVHVRR